MDTAHDFHSILSQEPIEGYCTVVVGSNKSQLLVQEECTVNGWRNDVHQYCVKA